MVYDSRLPIQQNVKFNSSTLGKFLYPPFTPKIYLEILKTAVKNFFLFRLREFRNLMFIENATIDDRT